MVVAGAREAALQCSAEGMCGLQSMSWISIISRAGPATLATVELQLLMSKQRSQDNASCSLPSVQSLSVLDEPDERIGATERIELRLRIDL